MSAQALRQQAYVQGSQGSVGRGAPRQNLLHEYAHWHPSHDGCLPGRPLIGSRKARVAVVRQRHGHGHRGLTHAVGTFKFQPAAQLAAETRRPGPDTLAA